MSYIFTCLNSNLIKQGKITPTSSTTSFDCGIANPKVVIARQLNGGWTWIYTSQFSNPLRHYSNLAVGANAAETYCWDNSISVNGSIVTLKQTDSGQEFEWIVC